jgi:UDP-2-acetamido-3-amino-2,3-dideoxy-glucuronate N-acetyltransferase
LKGLSRHSVATQMSAFIHPTAIIERNVRIGDDTCVWDSVHIRRDTVIGRKCIVGEKTHISYAVKVGDFVKINAFVYICTAVTIEDGVMLSAGCIFTNDRYPRATNPELSSLHESAPDEHTLPTLVRAGATIGAGAIIGCNLTIGRFAMVGMGSVVTRSVPDFHLVAGNPAKLTGYVCRCGEPIGRPGDEMLQGMKCQLCRRAYRLDNGSVIEAEGNRE